MSLCVQPSPLPFPSTLGETWWVGVYGPVCLRGAMLCEVYVCVCYGLWCARVSREKRWMLRVEASVLCAGVGEKKMFAARTVLDGTDHLCALSPHARLAHCDFVDT